MTKTIILSGLAITLRQPGQDEVLRFLDKRAASQDPDNTRGDFLDDGDEELLGCVTSPDRARMDAFVEDRPLATAKIAEAFRELAGAGLQLDEAPELVTEELRTAHARTDGSCPLVGFKAGELRLVLRRLSRMETKLLQRETAAAGRKVPSAAQLAEAGRQHLVQPAGEAAAVLWGRYPLLAYSLGLLLADLATAKLDSSAGKP